MKKITLWVLLLMVTPLFMGCETIKGMGQDIANTGDNIIDGVNKVTKPKPSS